MMGLATMRRMNAEAVAEAKAKGLEPRVATKDGDEDIRYCPLLGDYTPEGWVEIDELFVDSSGCGSPGEPALTHDQFLAKVKRGLGYGIGDRGQFQCYIRVFKKL